MVQADGARLRRQVRTDDDWNEAPAAIWLAESAQSSRATLKLIDAGTDIAGSSIRSHLDDERVGTATVGKCDQSIHAVVAADFLFIIDSLDLDAKHIAEQVANRLDGADFHIFHYFR